MATMVFCLTCKTVVWADDVVTVDVRGLMNEMRMPCPECGTISNFDGYGLSDTRVCGGDFWEGMRRIAGELGLRWSISPDCAWFNRPGGPDNTEAIANVVRAHAKEEALL